MGLRPREAHPHGHAVSFAVHDLSDAEPTSLRACQVHAVDCSLMPLPTGRHSWHSMGFEVYAVAHFLQKSPTPHGISEGQRLFYVQRRLLPCAEQQLSLSNCTQNEADMSLKQPVI